MQELSCIDGCKQCQRYPQQQGIERRLQGSKDQRPKSKLRFEGVIAADKDMDAVMSKMPQNGKPDPKLTAQLESTAKKYGFASFEEYNLVVDNIGLVMSGIDPATKKFVGAIAVIKAQIAEVQADKKMSAKDKKAALDDLNQSLKEPEPTIENKGNIDLVVKNFDKLDAIMGEDDDQK